MKYSILLAFVFILSNNIETNAQEITIWPGVWGQEYYQDYKRITKGEAESLIAMNPVAFDDWKKSKRHMKLGWISYGVGVGFTFWQLANLGSDKNIIAPTIASIASLGTFIGFIISSNNLKKDAVLNYNEGADVSSINLGITPNGVGLVMSF